ncbi:MAG: hypothetical protein KGI52_01415 [Burkholderiales bacterium]|nr:hypothetical protein [Burkholderiales bacterium]
MAIYFLLPSSIVRIVRSQVRILLAEACTGLLVSQGANFDQRGALVAHRIDQGSGGDKAQVQLLLRSLQMTFTNDGLALHLNDATDNMQEWFGSRLDSGGTAMAVDIYRIQRFTVPRESPQQALSLGLTMYSTPEIPFKGEGGSPRLGWKADDSDVAVIVR